MRASLTAVGFMRLAADIGRAPLWFCSSVSAGRLPAQCERDFVCLCSERSAQPGGRREGCANGIHFSRAEVIEHAEPLAFEVLVELFGGRYGD